MNEPNKYSEDDLRRIEKAKEHKQYSSHSESSMISQGLGFCIFSGLLAIGAFYLYSKTHEQALAIAGIVAVIFAAIGLFAHLGKK